MNSFMIYRLVSTLFLLTFFFNKNYCQQQNPNILLIIADDMGIDVTNGYLDSPRMPVTPTLDSLRDSGLIFTNAWSTPQCTPTRAAIMSGKYGIKTGVMRPPGNLDEIHTSLFRKIKNEYDDLYANAVIGKWHISNPVDYTHPGLLGVDHYEGLFTASVDDYYEWEKVENETTVPITEYVTTHFTDAAIDWVSDQDQPWFLWLAHVAPHSPFHEPPVGLFSQTNTNNNVGMYLAAIEAMDHEIGRLLASMDEATRANTVIIFVGDNGTPGAVIQGFESNHAKSSLYEGGIRVPMMISGKGITRIGESSSQLVQLADIHATILELTGISLAGGDQNSMSLKPLLSCDTDLERKYIYTDYENGNTLGYAIREEQYKLIEYENETPEFYDVLNDINELVDLSATLTAEQQIIYDELRAEAAIIRSDWSCQDGIQNGIEMSIDDCDNTCTEMDELNFENIGCCAVPEDPSVYYEFLVGDKRSIYSNDFPNHNYCFNPNLIPEQTYYNFELDLEPQLANSITQLVRENGRPARYFGVAKNGVIFAPAPATPFIFENPNTGEFNWDWVFEPINNQGDGADFVALDCASAHTGPQGYHYHGDMYEYIDTAYPGLIDSPDIPGEVIHIGWASDGFPILYRYGPDADGNIKELIPSFQLRSGLREGDGILAPCGPYTGKYTRDYEYICGKGDLDECNGIMQDVTIETASGAQTFSYFYVITASFPQIPRCIVGTASTDFENGTDNQLTGIDLDNDGFIEAFDCDDSNPDINPLAEEILGNDIDEDCNGLLTSVDNMERFSLTVGPNPSSGFLFIKTDRELDMTVEISKLNGEKVCSKKGKYSMDLDKLSSGFYILNIIFEDGKSIAKKIIVQ